jgi:ribose 5-phosphate isomerase B
MSKIYIGADHGGFELKEQLIPWLKSAGHQVQDCGAFTVDSEDDYPDYSFEVAESVADESAQEALGIILCRTSAGAVVAANKVPGIRAVTAQDEETAGLAREKNNANILGLGADYLDLESAKATITKFISTRFSQDERHRRRVRKIETYEGRNTDECLSCCSDGKCC